MARVRKGGNYRKNKDGKRDTYYWKAKEDGFRSRAAYKLFQINEKHELIKPGDSIVDLGAAPGGWLEVAKQLTDGHIIGVDLQRIAPIEGIETIKGDMTSERTIEKILKKVGEDGVEVVICDAAPNLSGNWSLDHARSIDLTTCALECAIKILKPGGHFVAKVFQGDMFDGFVHKLSRNFAFTKSYSPKASRSQSAEIYVIGKKFLSAPLKKGNKFDVEITEIGSDGDGVATVDGFVVFVKDVELGDKVNIKITDVKPNFAFAEVLKKNTN